MKPAVTIILAVVCSVTAVLAIQILDIDENEIIKENNMVNSLTFDCAEQWDEIQVEVNQIQSIQVMTSGQTERSMTELEKWGEAFMKNECFQTVNDWAYKTQDESSVWYSGIDWELFGFIEKEVNKGKLTSEEIAEKVREKYLQDNSAPVKSIVASELEEPPLEKPSFEGFTPKCGPGTVFDTESNSCVLG